MELAATHQSLSYSSVVRLSSFYTSNARSSSSSYNCCQSLGFTRIGLHLTPKHQYPGVASDQATTCRLVVRCESKEQPEKPNEKEKLGIGSPVIVTEAPKMVKTAASVPCLRVNSGLINPGDVGRIVSQKPKDVWAVRLSVGTYLIDGKYFKPLDLDN